MATFNQQGQTIGTQNNLSNPVTNSVLTFADLTDTQKQRLTSKFLDVHPLRCQSTLVEYVLQKSSEDEEAPFSYDDITNNSPTANIELGDQWVDLTESERDELLPIQEYLETKAENIRDHLEELQGDTECDLLQERLLRWESVVDKYQNNVQNLNDAEFYTHPEIYQWFSCSDWLIGALEEKGECTLDDEFWGRHTCGQSVTLDCVMQKIAFDWFVHYGEEGLTQEQAKELNL